MIPRKASARGFIPGGQLWIYPPAWEMRRKRGEHRRALGSSEEVA